MIIGLIFLLIAITGIAYAAFSYSKAGEKVNTITTGVMVMSYTESSNVISITNALPTTDATGKKLSKSGEYFDFSVASTIEGQALISYEIGLKKQSGSTMADNNIKLYLTEKNSDGTETEVTAPRVYREETSANSYTGRPVDEMSLYTGTTSSNVTKNYRLRMWVDESYNPQGDGGSLSFKVKVNVYGKSGSNSIGTALYGYTGTSQTFTAPQTGTYKIELWGAEGGSGIDSDHTVRKGGTGAYTTGEISLTKGETLYVYVGGKGTDSVLGTTSQIGGYNGGGAGYAGGGGATDIRLTSGTWNDTTSLASRLMVASGGGGSGRNRSDSDPTGSAIVGGIGGAGGSLSGNAATLSDSTYLSYQGNGATAILGGQGGTTTVSNVTAGLDGSFGIGGAGGDVNKANRNNGSGGGSGYYGGGGGTACASICAGGAGSGSSYISGYTGCVAITSATSITPRNDSKGVACTDGTTDVTCSYHYSGKKFVSSVMKAGDEVMPTYDGAATMTGNRGHGFAKITFKQ